MKKVLIVLLLISLIGLITVGGVYAGNFIKSSFKDGPFFYLRKLNLTDEQKTKIDEILKELKNKSEKVLDEIKKNNEKEKEIISKEVLDVNGLNLIVESQIKNIVDLLYLKKDAYLKIVDVLNNEQRKIFPTFTFFLKTKPFIFKNEKISEFMEKSDERVRNLIRIGRRLNLNDEQKEILKEMIKNEYKRKFEFLHKIELRFLIKKLDLTDEQILKLNELLKDEREKKKEYLEKIKDNNSKQREILNKDSYYKENLSKTIDEYLTLESGILSLRKNLYYEYLKILTPEQRKKSPTSLFFFYLK